MTAEQKQRWLEEIDRRSAQSWEEASRSTDRAVDVREFWRRYELLDEARAIEQTDPT